jgi:hypothetical protein
MQEARKDCAIAMDERNAFVAKTAWLTERGPRSRAPSAQSLHHKAPAGGHT